MPTILENIFIYLLANPLPPARLKSDTTTYEIYNPPLFFFFFFYCLFIYFLEAKRGGGKEGVRRKYETKIACLTKS